MNESLVTLKNIVVDYPANGRATNRAVDDISLEVAAGEILGIVGESGSGKSTLGKVIAGFLAPTAGSYRLDGVDQYGAKRNRRNAGGSRDVQMIFQHSATALNPRLRAASSVAEAFVGGGRITAASRERAVEYLREAGLTPEHGDRRPDGLSGGQRQRVAIARALAAGPRVLVCDEAVSALDVSARSKILNLLIRIRRERGTAMVFISHDLSVVSQLVDRVVVMHNGRVAETGPVKQVIHAPQAEYTRSLLAAIPRLERTPARPLGSGAIG